MRAALAILFSLLLPLAAIFAPACETNEKPQRCDCCAKSACRCCIQPGDANGAPAAPLTAPVRSDDRAAPPMGAAGAWTVALTGPSMVTFPRSTSSARRVLPLFRQHCALLT